MFATFVGKGLELSRRRVLVAMRAGVRNTEKVKCGYDYGI